MRALAIIAAFVAASPVHAHSIDDFVKKHGLEEAYEKIKAENPWPKKIPGAYILPQITIRSCYDGDTCTTSTGEKIRLACIDTPELRGKKADPIPAIAARNYLHNLVVNSPRVGIRRITTDRYGRTVAELFTEEFNVQKLMVDSGHATVVSRYAKQCPWTQK